MHFRYLEHSEIDLNRWDACIDSSSIGSIYAYSWYLNTMCDQQWDAIVFGDYEAVFPLPKRKKFGLNYIYHPFFCQQLGLFHAENKCYNIQDFLMAIPKKFVRVHLQLHSQNQGIPCHRKRTNFVLDLNTSAEALQKNFNKDALQNLKKCADPSIEYRTTSHAALVLNLHKAQWGLLDTKVQEADYQRFLKVCQEAEARGLLKVIEAWKDEHLLGAGLFIQSKKRLHYLVSGPTEEGRKISIMHGIILHSIQAHAGNPLLLDFEGSDIPGVAVFYKKWGATAELYCEYFKKFPWS